MGFANTFTLKDTEKVARAYTGFYLGGGGGGQTFSTPSPRSVGE